MRLALIVGALALVLAGCVSQTGSNQEQQNGSADQASPLLPSPPVKLPLSTPVPGFFDVFVADITLVREADPFLQANVGPHCGSVFLRDAHVAVEDLVYDSLNGSRALLVVNGSVEGNWSTFGAEPYGLALPVGIRVSVGHENVVVANVTWNETTGNVLIDGAEVSLPHAWTISAPDTSWRLEGSLSHITSKIETWHRDGPCR